MAHRIINKSVDAPCTAITVIVIGMAIDGIYIAYHSHFTVTGIMQKMTDGRHIVHQCIHIGEDILVYPLKNILCTHIGAHQIGLIDMAGFNL